MVSYKVYIKILGYLYLCGSKNWAPCASDVGDSLKMNPTVASNYLRRLWQWGYAERKKDPEDKVYRYSITKFGIGRLERSGIEL